MSFSFPVVSLFSSFYSKVDRAGGKARCKKIKRQVVSISYTIFLPWRQLVSTLRTGSLGFTSTNLNDILILLHLIFLF